jgi:hypothetical protein
MTKVMTSSYCEKVKQGENCADDFTAFLRHVEGCKDCIRRISSQIIIKFKQTQMESK